MTHVTDSDRVQAKVVIVEDNPITRKVLRVTLESGGYVVAEGDTGSAGLALVESTSPNLVLLDFVLPDMTGDRLCEQIRQLPQGRDVPVVLLTGQASRLDNVSGLFSACLLKPFEPSRLLHEVEAVLASGSVSGRPHVVSAVDFQSAALSLMSAVSEVLSRPDYDNALGDVLLHCLDAFGVATGVLYLRGSDDELRFHSQAGLTAEARDAARRAFDAPEVLERARGQVRTIELSGADRAEERFLRAFGHTAATLVPFIILGQPRGTLVLGTDPRTLAMPAWQTFARALGAQLGQAVALGQAAAEARQFDALVRHAIDAAPGGLLMIDDRGAIVLANAMIEQIFGYTEAELKGRTVELLVPQAARAGHVGDREAFLANPVKRRMGGGRELFGRHKSGRQVPVEIGLAPVFRGDRRHVIATVIDISERLRGQEALRRSAQMLDAAQQLAHLGSYEFDPASGEGTLSEELSRILGRSSAEPPRFPRVLLESVHPEDLPTVRASILAMLAGHPTDASETYRIVRPDGEVRWVEATRRIETDRDGRLLRAYGALLDVTEHRKAAAALTHATHRLEALSRRLLDVQEAERRQLARELHDEIGQALTAAQLQVQTILRYPDEPGWRQYLQDAGATLARALNQLRSLTLELRPPLIDELGLVPALRWLADRVGHSSGIAVEIEAATIPRLPGNIELAGFRIAQEALNNVMRHAHARHARVTVAVADGALSLRVRDDGHGFDVDDSLLRAARGGSLGLVGMQERARLVGGTVGWRSSPGHGTEVTATFPGVAA